MYALYIVFIHIPNTRYLKLDDGTTSFEERLIADVWTQQITSVST